MKTTLIPALQVNDVTHAEMTVLLERGKALLLYIMCYGRLIALEAGAVAPDAADALLFEYMDVCKKALDGTHLHVRCPCPACASSLALHTTVLAQLMRACLDCGLHQQRMKCLLKTGFGGCSGALKTSP